MKKTSTTDGFTLIETLVAVTLLTVAIAAPMALTSKSLAAAYRARDQITAFHLAQEAIETVRSVRDHNILLVADGDLETDLLDGILSSDDDSQVFTVDTTAAVEDAIDLNACSDECPRLKIDSDDIYGYAPGAADTRFTRTVRAETIRENDSEVPQEVKITATVSWQTGSFQIQSVEIYDNLYRWVSDNTSGNE